MGPPKFGAPGNCPICPPLKPALYTHGPTVYVIHDVSRLNISMSLPDEKVIKRLEFIIVERLFVKTHFIIVIL